VCGLLNIHLCVRLFSLIILILFTFVLLLHLDVLVLTFVDLLSYG